MPAACGKILLTSQLIHRTLDFQVDINMLIRVCKFTRIDPLEVANTVDIITAGITGCTSTSTSTTLQRDTKQRVNLLIFIIYVNDGRPKL